MSPDNIGKNLRRILKDLDLTQIELAEKCGLTQGAVSQIINGERNPSLESLIKILGVVPIKFEKLLEESNDNRS